MDDGPVRELAPAEMREIRDLVTQECANSDRAGRVCLPLDSACYMLGKCHTGAFCRYFEESVLPLSPGLVESLTGQASGAKFCPVCERRFYADGRRTYCSSRCRDKAKRARSREWMKAARNRV